MKLPSFRSTTVSLMACFVIALIGAQMIAAQVPQQTTSIQSATLRSRFATWDGAGTRPSGSRQCVDLTGSGVTSHAVQFQTTGAPASNTISVTADTGSGTYSSVGSSTTTTSATISFTGTYKTVCVTATFSDGASVDASYNGQVPVTTGGGTTQDVNVAQVGGVATASVAGAAITRNSPAMTGYITQASFTTNGLWLIQNTSTNQVTGTTTLLQSATFTNVTGSAVAFQLMDGNTKYLIGPTFSVPANSVLTLNFPSGTLMTSGINISANTANALTVSFWGLQ